MTKEELKKIFLEKANLPEKEQINKDSKTKLEVWKEENKIKIYPTDISYFYFSEGIKVVEGNCLRKQFFNFFEVEQTNKPELEVKEIFELGCCVEEIIKSELIEAGVLTRENTEVKVEIPFGDIIISGRIDAVLNDGTMIEIKSHKHHDYLEKKLEAGEMIEYHYSQAAAYLVYMKLNNPENNNKLIMWYKNKNNLSNNLIEVELKNDGFIYVNDKKIDKFNFSTSMERMKEFSEYVKKKELPPRDYGYYNKNETKKNEVLRKLGKINYRDFNEIMEGKKVLPFDCKTCGYKDLCLNCN